MQLAPKQEEHKERSGKDKHLGWGLIAAPI